MRHHAELGRTSDDASTVLAGDRPAPRPVQLIHFFCVTHGRVLTEVCLFGLCFFNAGLCLQTYRPQYILLLLARRAVLLMRQSRRPGNRGNKIVGFDCQHTAITCVEHFLGGISEQHSLDTTSAHRSDDNQVGSLML